MNKFLCFCAQSIILFYQAVFITQRRHPHCKFFPSCSDYTIMALKKHGFLTGICFGLWRILRCNPFTKGGVDLP
ncbi:MAG: membrane protein insertion efficiency factor YidD [Candidatus Omnitrophica bacterium]|nr:membrane protein insertion efficiency factor YidD [Candidatus Omnitrophota bacterium]